MRIACLVRFVPPAAFQAGRCYFRPQAAPWSQMRLAPAYPARTPAVPLLESAKNACSSLSWFCSSARHSCSRSWAPPPDRPLPLAWVTEIPAGWLRAVTAAVSGTKPPLAELAEIRRFGLQRADRRSDLCGCCTDVRLRLSGSLAETGELPLHCFGRRFYRVCRRLHPRLQIIGLCSNGDAGFNVSHSSLSVINRLQRAILVNGGQGARYPAALNRSVWPDASIR